MEGESLFKDMRSVRVTRLFESAVVVIEQYGLVIGVSAVVDNFKSALTRSLVAKVCYALLGDDDVNVVFGVVDMAAHRNNGRDFAVLSNGRSIENGEIRVSCKVAGAADTVHHLCSGDVGGVDVTVNIDFDSGIHSDNA